MAGLTGIGRLIPMKWLFWAQNAFARKDRKKKTKRLFYSNYQPDYLYVTLDRQWSTRVVELPFEDTCLMCPEGWEHVLAWVYGDYKKLPPREQRKPSHARIEILVDE